MRIRDLVYETTSALNANRGRSLLTVLGIVIGISAVIAMTSLIGGIKKNMVGSLGLGQARLVMVSQYYRSMTDADVEAMETEMSDEYEFVSPQVYSGGEVLSDTKKAEGFFNGVDERYPMIMGQQMSSGRFFNEEECDGAQLVCVIDRPSVKKLFGSDSVKAEGKTLRINGAEYMVTGVLDTGSTSRNDESVTLYMPFTTCCERVRGETGFSDLQAFAREDADMTTIADKTKSWIKEHFQIPEDEVENNTYIMTMDSVIKELNNTMASFEILMTTVASISLVVGGIGIMNMMLTNVTERIREIGLRKALGAKRQDITNQFLLESVFITLAGGIIGIVFGYLGAYALSGLAGGALGSAATGDSSAITPTIDVSSVLFVTAVCIGIGIVFGYYPARRAARLDPVESLHYQ